MAAAIAWAAHHTELTVITMEGHMVASITLTVQGEARGAVGPLEGCADPRIWLWFEAERSVGREYPLGGARCPSPTPNLPRKIKGLGQHAFMRCLVSH
jgi:hypothetical protein